MPRAGTEPGLQADCFRFSANQKNFKMKRLFLLFFILHPSFFTAWAQRPFEGVYRSEALNINVELNLYEKEIKVPDMDDEKCYGFFRGNINGIWAVMKVISMDDDKAVVRLVSDLGFEAQTVEISRGAQDIVVVKMVKDNNMRGVKDHKYVKLPKTFELHPFTPLP